MSLANFIPTVWAAGIQRDLEARYVYASLVNRDYEGEISSFGDTVKINSVGEISVGDYVKNSTSIAPDQLTSSQQELLINQAKYFAFYVDDIDQAQTKPKVMEEAIRKSSRALAGVADTFVRDLMLNGAALSHDGADLDTTNIADYMGSINQKLDEANNDPNAERFVVVPPWLRKLIVISYQGNTQSEEVQRNGLVGRYFGLNVYMSTLTPKEDSTENDIVIAGTRAGTTMGEQVVKMEAYRPESSFADAVKGLHVYGGEVVEPNALLTSVVTEATA